MLLLSNYSKMQRCVDMAQKQPVKEKTSLEQALVDYYIAVSYASELLLRLADVNKPVRSEELVNYAQEKKMFRAYRLNEYGEQIDKTFKFFKSNGLVIREEGLESLTETARYICTAVKELADMLARERLAPVEAVVNIQRDADIYSKRGFMDKDNRWEQKLNRAYAEFKQVYSAMTIEEAMCIISYVADCDSIMDRVWGTVNIELMRVAASDFSQHRPSHHVQSQEMLSNLERLQSEGSIPAEQDLGYMFRQHLEVLTDMGLLRARRTGMFPSGMTYSLTETGKYVLQSVEGLERKIAAGL